MKATRSRVLVCLVLVVGITLSGVYFFVPTEEYAMSGISDRVSAGAIRSVELGISEEDVYAFLGKPVMRSVNQPHGRVYLIYSSKVEGSFWQPRVEVVLKDGEVVHVWAQRTVFWGDEFDRDFYSKSRFGTTESDDFERLFGSGGKRGSS